MKKVCLIISFIILISANLLGQDPTPVTIRCNLFSDQPNEKIHLRISNTLTDEVWYDSLATVAITAGFKDTVHLDAGTYKCEILQMGAYVSMPIITLDNGHSVPWGYPGCECYLFTLPGGNHDTYSNLNISSCDLYVAPSLKYSWSESGIYKDTIPNSIGYDSIMTINLTIISIGNTVTTSSGSLLANEPDAEYQWLVCNSGSIIVGAVEQNYAPPANGLYSVRITKGGCVKSSDCYSYVVTDIIEQLNYGVPIYPNPTNGLLNIDASAWHAPLYIEITDISGKSLAKYVLSEQNLIQVDLNGFNSGFYFANIYTKSNRSTFKIIKK